MAYTLATAAEVARVTKPTVFRWIKKGHLSATRTEAGEYRIDPAELQRYLDSVAETQLPNATVQQGEMAAAAPITPNDTLPDMIALRCEVDKLKALLDAEKQRAEELRADRDRWADQAQRLALPIPATKRNAGWWPFRRAS
jgi:excisionase family DNA binding protein